jgi:hypothetical protein
MKKIITGLLIAWSLFSNAQPSIDWQKCLGGSLTDYADSIQQTTDGGYILTGTTYSNNGDVSGNHGGVYDAWVVKLTSLGVLQWQKCLGGSLNDAGYSIKQTADGGYILTGYTNSIDGDVSGNHGGGDTWVVKLTSLGVIQWQKCLGGSLNDNGRSIQQTADGGYILTCETLSNNGDVSGNHGDFDVWVVKLTSLGVIQWQKCLGGSDYDNGRSIQQTTDGGYILTGETLSNNGDVSGNHGDFDVWVVKLTSLGVLQWQKCLGGSSGDYADSIQQTTDGGYILTSTTDSNNGDVFGNNGLNDIWVVKLTSLGVIQWQKCLGGSSGDYGRSFQQTTEGGYILTGYTLSNNGDVSGNHGGTDAWVVKLNSLGLIQWQKCLGGSLNDNGRSIQQTTDGGYILTGETLSNNGDVSGNHGDNDVWVVKLSSNLEIEEQSYNNLFSLYPNPVVDVLKLKLDTNFKNQSYSICNVDGKIIKQGVINNKITDINVENLSKGVYFIKLANNKACKFIKE